MDKKIDRNIIMDYIMVTIGITIAAAAVYFFLIPANLVVGSVSGLALVIGEVIPVSISSVTLVVNLLLLVVGYFVVGKEFGVKTIYTSLMFPGLIYIFERVFPNQQPIMNDPWLDLITYVLILGISQTILFRANASSGGLDIVAKIFNHLWGIPIGVAVSVVSSVVSLSAIFVYDIKVVVLGLIGTYLNGLIITHFTDAFNQKKRVCIISQKHELIADYILNVLMRGVTLYPRVGAYTKKEDLEIQIIIENNEVMGLIRYINEVDKDAFVTVGNIDFISGKWHTKKQIKENRKRLMANGNAAHQIEK
ncbi:MAG: YitT family protein [Cellulosilyticaceae bacterium]